MAYKRNVEIFEEAYTKKEGRSILSYESKDGKKRYISGSPFSDVKSGGIESVEQTTKSEVSGGTNVLTITTTNGYVSQFEVKNGDKGDKGDQGNSGYSGAAGELEVVNNLTEGGETAALSAEMGKELNEKKLDKDKEVRTTSVISEDKIIQDSYIKGANGDIAALAHFKVYRFPVIGGKTYLVTGLKVSSSSVAFAIFHTSEGDDNVYKTGDVISSYGDDKPAEDREIVAPADAAYLYVQKGNTTTAVTPVCKEVVTTFIDNEAKLNAIGDVSELDKTISESILSLESDFDTFKPAMEELIGTEDIVVDLSSLIAQNFIIDDDNGKWRYGGSHYVIEVAAGEVYELTSSASVYARICTLAEHNPVVGTDATAESFFIADKNQTYTINVGEGQHYLYFSALPQTLKLKGVTGRVTELEEKITIAEKDVENIFRRMAVIDRKNDFEWGEFDKPYFIFQLDDSNSNVVGHTNVFLDANVPLCYAAIANNIDATKLAKMQEMVNAGGEVLCHYSGSPTDDTPFEDWLNLIRTNLFKLEDMGFVVRGLIRADSTQANSVKGEQICRRYFDYANNGMGAVNSTQYNIPYWGLWGATKDQVKAKFDADAAINGIHVYPYHGQGGISTETWQDETAMAELLSYIKTNHPNVVFSTYSAVFDLFKSTRLDNMINALINQ